MKSQPQKKLARAYRIRGSLVLFRSAQRSPFKSEKTLPRTEPWWTLIVGIPIFLRTLFRLVCVCPHRHKGPPITSREPIPHNLHGFQSLISRGTFITCLDCGQKFAYNSTTRRLTDFWGMHDVEALAGVRRKVVEFFSPLRGFAAKAGSLKIRVPIAKFVRSVQLWSSNGPRASSRPASHLSHRPRG
jgi:hypothetical protein